LQINIYFVILQLPTIEKVTVSKKSDAPLRPRH
jgi:hypothetical protein